MSRLIEACVTCHFPILSWHSRKQLRVADNARTIQLLQELLAGICLSQADDKEALPVGQTVKQLSRASWLSCQARRGLTLPDYQIPG